ncbi:MAG: PAS domain S-box protein [Cyclobacteriaceae bacterium]|nr:PAS domain S-box protein [Cyclobacteriaceae bacterium]
MESITDSIVFAIDENLSIVGCNKNFTKETKIFKKQAIEQPVSNFFKGISSLKRIANGQSKSSTIDLTLKENLQVIFRFNVAPILLNPFTKGHLLVGNAIRTREDWDETFLQILKGTYNEVGGDFFKSITKMLAQTLHMRYALIGELGHEQNKEIVTTIAFWDKNEFKPNFTYDLKGSPCENVVDRKQLIVHDKVADLYPKDKGLSRLGAKSYIGTPIFYKDGTPFGLVVVMDTKPTSISQEDAYKLHFFANRIGIEMEWFKNDLLLKEQEEKLRTIIQSLPDPVYCQDNNGVYETCNDAYLEFFGISDKDILNKPVNRLPDQITANRILSATEKLEKIHGTNRIETSLITNKNYAKNAIVIRSPIIDKEGKQTGIVGVIQDISEMKEAEKSLKINEEKYRTLFTKANDTILLMSNDIFVDCNPKALEMFGCSSRDKLIGKPPYLFSPVRQPDKRNSKEKALEKINAAISGVPQTFYWKHKKYNGDLFDAEVSLNAFYIKDELFIQAIVRDVSEKMKASKEMEEQTMRMEKMYEFTSDTSKPFIEQISKILKMATQSLGMQIGALSEINGEEFTFNNFYSNISDFSTDDVHYLSQTYCAISVEENKLVAIPNFKKSKYSKRKAYELLQFESYIGVPYWVRGKLRGTLSFSSFYPVDAFRSADSDFVQIIAQWIGSNLEREEYEDYLRKNQALLDTLLREIPIDFSVRDKSLKMLMQSNVGKQVWGNNEGKDIDFSDVNEESAKKWKDIFKRVLKGETIKGENYVKILGKHYNLISIASPIKVNGVVEQVTVIHIDISQLKKAEKQLKAQNEKLKKLNAELDRFVYSASHDLRAPLASLLGLIDLSKREPLNPALKEYLSLMDKSIVKLDGFISDITDYSRNLRLKTNNQKVDFKELATDIFNSLVYMSTDEIDFSVSTKGNYDFYSDVDRLRLILSNLISNSIRYRSTRRKPSIKIEVRKKKEEATIEVIDNGIGIEKKYQKKVFEMFFRANDQNTGSGLGLFIVKETTDKLKGKIKLDSEAGKGSTFTLELPNIKA